MVDNASVLTEVNDLLRAFIIKMLVFLVFFYLFIVIRPTENNPIRKVHSLKDLTQVLIY